MAAADRTQQILPGGQSAAPFTYTIPGATEFTLLAVRAIWDGSAAAGAFLPCVQLVSDAGVVMAQTIGSSVAAGGSADATFAPFLESPTAATPAADTLTAAYIAAGVTALWKYNELSGSTAHDATGNGFDLTASPNPPTWNQPSLGPGTPSAEFLSDPTQRMTRGTYQALGTGSAPFSVFGWLLYLDDDPHDFYYAIGQGVTAGLAHGTGWALGVEGANVYTGNHLHLFAANGVPLDTTAIVSDNPLTASTDYFVAITYDGTTWRMYIDGVVQAMTSTNALAPQTGIIMGAMTSTGGGAAYHMDGLLSWWGVVPGVALTATQLLEIYNARP